MAKWQQAPAVGTASSPAAAPAGKWQTAPAFEPGPEAQTAPPAPQSLGDQLSAGFSAGVNAIPIAGPTILGGLENLKGMVQGRSASDVAATDQAQVEANPVAATVGTIAGNVLPLAAGGEIPLIGKGLGMTGNLLERIGFGAASGAGITAADDIARGKSFDQAGHDAIAGGIIGAAVPAALRGAAAAKNAVVSGVRGAAGNGAATSRLMKDAASPMFDAAKHSGVIVTPQSYENFAVDTATKIAQQGLDKQLHPDTYRVLETMLERGADRDMSMNQLHIVRQLAQDAARGTEPRDASKARQIVDAIDDYIGNLKPTDIAVHPSRAPAAIANLQNGIKLWSQASKTATIEDALYRASNAASGLENGIRNEFRTLLRNPRSRLQFTDEERGLIENVVRGSLVANLTKLAGKFGFGHGAAGNMLGGSIGFGAGAAVGGPIGGILAALGGAASRRVSEALTERGAQRVLNAVSGGAAGAQRSAPRAVIDALQRINRTPVNIPIAPASVSTALMQSQHPSITVNGGAR